MSSLFLIPCYFVFGKKQFPHPEALDSQRYALAVAFSFDGEEIDMYNLVRQRAWIREKVRVQNQVVSENFGMFFILQLWYVIAFITQRLFIYGELF